MPFTVSGFGEQSVFRVTVTVAIPVYPVIIPHAHLIPPLLVEVSARGFNLISLPTSEVANVCPPFVAVASAHVPGLVSTLETIVISVSFLNFLLLNDILPVNCVP